MDRTEKIKAIQHVLGVVEDGKWGPKSSAAFDAVIHPGNQIFHAGKASSFADPKDIEAFRKCKATGKTDHQCFGVGDNGVGCWGDSTVQGTGPSCAISPDDMISRWGSVADAKHKLIEVTANDMKVTCVLKDMMPPDDKKLNPAIIDLNPDAGRALNLIPPFMVNCVWAWL